MLLIFDEVVTGFRVAPGGAQALYGIVPDLTTLAKIVAGGMPGGAVAGRKDILDWLENRIAPWSPGDYRHNSGTGEDNAAAHLRSLTIGHEVIVPVTKGKLDFGPWQRVFYGEWDGQRPKRVLLKAMGE